MLSAAAGFVRAQTPLPFGFALALVVVFFLAVVAVFGWLVAPRLAAQIDELSDSIPGAYAKATDGRSATAAAGASWRSRDGAQRLRQAAKIARQATNVMASMFAGRPTCSSFLF